ncbi:MAG: hypothetical protein CMH65_00935 [Nevskiales bacterium]|nr:hypothetical protein [Nevskiales bacterium]
MSLASPSAPLSAAQARAKSIGYLTLIYTGERLPLQVLHSAAGHFIGTQDDEGPSRESVEYFPTRQSAQQALDTGAWMQRRHP